MSKRINVSMFITACLTISLQLGCGLSDVPEVKEAFLIGITPHADFAQSGLVDFAILPKDEVGQAIIDTGLEVNISALLPAGTSVMSMDSRAVLPQPGKQLVTALDLDSSGSMGSNDPGRLRVQAAKLFIDQLDASDLVGVFDFGAGKTPPFSSTRMLADFTADGVAAKAAIDLIKASGGTPMYPSIVELMDHFNQQHPAGVASRSMIVLGDGQPNGGGTLQACCDAAKAAGIPINTIGFGPAADSSPRASTKAVQTLRSLAACSGGAYSGVVEASALNQAFTTMGQAAKSGSVVITVKYGPIPMTGTPVSGDVAIGNGAQSPVAIQYAFVAP
jgi:hypothetical protein